MKKTRIYLDMDGTIADLYSELNWLGQLENECSGLFRQLRPLTSEKELLDFFPLEYYEITILSMTPKDASIKYCEQVIKEKNEWLDIFFPKIQKRIYKEYGHNKNLKNSCNAILIDDNEIIRKNWRGLAINPCDLW